jgi:hypothetical protein
MDVVLGEAAKFLLRSGIVPLGGPLNTLCDLGWVASAILFLGCWRTPRGAASILR